MIINTNMAALNANRMANVNSSNAAKAMKQLSSGLRINSAADDAAGLAISTKMQGQINGLNQASSNSQTGVSLLQTAEGALTETTSQLQRMRELAVQASSDTNTTADRAAMQTESNQISAQIDNIANTTQFNTKNLLNGGAGIAGTVTSDGTTPLAAGQQVNISGGAEGVVAGGTLQLTNVAAATSASETVQSDTTGLGEDLQIGGKGAALTINGATVNIAAGTVGSAIATAINNYSSQTGVTASYTAATGAAGAQLKFTSTAIGSAANVDITGIVAPKVSTANDTFVSVIAGVPGVTNVTAGGTDSGTTAITALTAFNSTGADATATSNGSLDKTGVADGNKATSVSSVGNTLTFHGGNYDGLQLQVDSTMTGTTNPVDVKIDANNALTMQIGANAGQTMSLSINSMTSTALGVNNLDLTTQTGAESAITSIDTATAAVSTQQAQLGAYENRLTSTITNLGTTSQNLTAAQSQITDVDMAATMAEYSKDNVEAQAAQAMIAQANQQPSQVLALLR